MNPDKKKTIFESKLFKYLLLFMSLTIIAYYVSEKLIYGARWSSGLPLGGVDNFFAGGTFYPTSSSSITPGSSYFPGMMLLAFIFRSLFGFGADTAFVFWGGFLWVLTAYSFATMASIGKKTNLWFFILAVLFFVIQFPAARHYLLEVHPDIPSLICFLWGVLLLPERDTRNRFLRYIATVFLFYFSGLFKQNAAFLFMGLGLYTFFCKSISWKEKAYILICEIIAGVALIFTILSIDGCWLNCVTINAKHPYMNWRWILHYTQNVIKYDCIFIMLVAYFFYLMVKRKISLSQKEEMWLWSSIAWTAFCLFSSIKKGADDGNMEAAIVSLMPFALFAFNINKAIKNGKCKFLNGRFTFAHHSQKVLYVLCLISIAVTINCGFKIKHNYEQYQNRLAAQQDFSKWISENFKGKNIAYNTCVYEFINGADIVKKSDLNTIEVWHWAGLVNDLSLQKLSQKEQWDVIMTLDGIDGKYWPKSFGSFELIDEALYPSINNYVPSKVKLYVKKKY